MGDGMRRDVAKIPHEELHRLKGAFIGLRDKYSKHPSVIAPPAYDTHP
jgi:hypothetical protein